MRQNSTAQKPEEQAGILDTSLRVTTPEKVSFQYQVVGPFRRVIAYFLDCVITVVFFIGVTVTFNRIVMAMMPLLAWLGLDEIVNALVGVAAGLRFVLLFITFWFYGAIMETYFNGQTIGKRILKYRVLSKDGHSIDGVQAVLRNFFRVLDLMPVAPIPFMAEFFDVDSVGSLPTCLFGLICMSLSPRFQRIGDLVAGTMVVIEERKWTPELAKFDDARVAKLAEEIPSGFQVSRSMSRALADFVEQRQYLPYLRASEIASHLARPLVSKFGMPEDTDHDLLLCSLYYKTFMQFQAGEPDVEQSISMPQADVEQASLVPPEGEAVS